MAIRVPPGVVRGESPGMVLNRFSATNWVRWQNGNLMPIGGWVRRNKEPLLDIPRAVHVWFTGQQIRQAAYICDSKVYTEFNGVFTDRTPAGWDEALIPAQQGYGSGIYNMGLYGDDTVPRGSVGILREYIVTFSVENWAAELMVLSSADGRIYSWNPDANPVEPLMTEVTALPGEGTIPPFLQAMLVTDERHLMVFGGQGTPNRVSWSDRENYRRWNFTNVTGQAGYYDLQAAGKILCARRIPGGILIFTSSGIWLGRYLGSPNYYGFNRIAEGATPISAQAVAVAGGRAFWMGVRGFWKYEGGVVSPHPTTLGTSPFSELADDVAHNRVYVGANGAFPEIWYLYPSKRNLSPESMENDRYVVQNYDEGWWADGWLDRSVLVASAIDGFPVGTDTMGYVYIHETGWLSETASRAEYIWAEIGNVSPDDGEYNWQYNQAMVDSPKNAHSLKFDFYGRRVRGGPEVPLQLGLKPRADGYLDLHFTARDVRIKISSTEDGPWAIGAPILHKMIRRGQI